MTDGRERRATAESSAGTVGRRRVRWVGRLIRRGAVVGIGVEVPVGVSPTGYRPTVGRPVRTPAWMRVHRSALVPSGPVYSRGNSGGSPRGYGRAIHLRLAAPTWATPPRERRSSCTRRRDTLRSSFAVFEKSALAGI